MDFTLDATTIENKFSGSKCICHRFAVKREKHPQRHRQPNYLWDVATNPARSGLNRPGLVVRAKHAAARDLTKAEAAPEGCSHHSRVCDGHVEEFTLC